MGVASGFNCTPIVDCQPECEGARHLGCDLAITHAMGSTEGHGIRLDDEIVMQLRQDPLSSQLMINHMLLKSARDDDEVTLARALREGADVETRGVGLTPLMYAAISGNERACHLLLAAHASVNAQDEDGARPLHLAAAAGHAAVCIVLLRGGAEAAVQDEDGRTPFAHVPAHLLATAHGRLRWKHVLDTPPEAVDVLRHSHPVSARVGGALTIKTLSLSKSPRLAAFQQHTSFTLRQESTIKPKPRHGVENSATQKTAPLLELEAISQLGQRHVFLEQRRLEWACATSIERTMGTPALQRGNGEVSHI